MDMDKHLRDRHMDVCLYPNTFIDHAGQTATFMLFDQSRRFVGFQQYRPNASKNVSKEKKNRSREGRYFTYVTKNHLAVWGLESFDFDPRLLVVTEGIFDACRLHNFGVPSVAILGSSVKHIKNWLFCTGRTIFKVEDSTGSNLGKYRSLYIPSNVNDLGDCTDDQVMDVVRQLKHGGDDDPQS